MSWKSRNYNIPERNVEIVEENSEDMIELMPRIVEEHNTLITH